MKKNTPAPTARAPNGRYLRFSHRYNAWQTQTRGGYWINCNAHLARSYFDMGFPVAVHGTTSPPPKPTRGQMQLFSTGQQGE